MPAGTVTRISTGYTHPSRRNTKKYKNRYGRKRWGRIRRVPRGLFRKPRAGGRQLAIPMKLGYDYAVIGTGAASLDFDQTVGLNSLPAAWFTRYEPIFSYVRVNKVRVEITCGYNIGQPGIGTHPSLFRMWSKKAMSTAETPPDSITEWLNMQNARRNTFSGVNNSVNYFFTPAYETTVQPLNTAVTQLRLIYKQWQSIKATPAEMTPHIGIIGQIHRLDGGPITNAMSFRVNVTLYCQLKGIKEL